MSVTVHVSRAGDVTLILTPGDGFDENGFGSTGREVIHAGEVRRNGRRWEAIKYAPHASGLAYYANDEETANRPAFATRREAVEWVTA